MDARSRRFGLMSPFNTYEVGGGRDASSRVASAWPTSSKFAPKMHKMPPPAHKKLVMKCCALFLILLATRWACPSPGRPFQREYTSHQLMLRSEACQGRRVHMYDIPRGFNTALLEYCDGGLVPWIKFCKHHGNFGFGERVNASTAIFGEDWYRTDAYMLEVIFHERMQSYPCITDTAEEADIYFVPFFAGLDALPFLYNETKRLHQQGLELLAWLRQNATEPWRRYEGRDHFMIAGRTAWDFAFPEEGNKDWGTSLFDLEAMKHVTFMVLERRPWRPNEQAIPYPVGFHPASPGSLELWIQRVREAKRTALFSFSGALRPQQVGSIREILSQQCVNASSRCSRLDCASIKCSHNPEPIYESLLHADFCLQPRGDTATRRSTIDSVVSGCIPVLFHKDTAETQYTWHLPPELDEYSVFIPEDCIMNGTCVVENILLQIRPSQVRKMREKLISIIPNVVYRHPAAAGLLSDAFDLAIEGMRHKVASMKAAL